MASVAVADNEVAVTGELTASEIDSTGTVTLEASLAAFTRFDLESGNLLPTDSGQSPDAAFELIATTLRVESVEAAAYAKGPRGFVSSPAESSNQTYRDAKVDGLDNRPGYRFDVFPSGIASVNVSTGCATLQASTKNTYSAVPMVSAASPTFETNVANSVLWTECGKSAFTISGSFALILWEWDAELHADGQTVALPSGTNVTSFAPEPASSLLYPTVSHARQQYLYAQDAVLRIPYMDSTTHWAYLDAAKLSVEGTMDFSNVTGQLHQDGVTHPLQARSLTATGSLALEATSTGQGGALQGRLQGGMQAIDADGHALDLSSTSVQAVQSTWAWWLLAGVAVVAVPLSVPRVRRGRIAACLERSRTHFINLDFDAAQAWARKALDLAPQQPEGHYRLAQALTQLGDTEAALRHHGYAGQGLQGEWVLENARQAAEAALLAGNLTLARQWLETALRVDGDLLHTLEDSSPLHQILSSAWWLEP